ncbi:sensor histidine kinase RegB [Flavimaricola marinus]|uniref:histidine kinase n=1 Tax=Flavimaricola marinus TaxID=1819565 RepID=A0A238LCS2_9RHOB|nr:ActS/PrrB/RegB family redox-sensitive histidine kinase [Flavimaricola marinus]SMY07215.1 Sensor histidine kinase RegB [Flavimaricola marinus]
MTNSDYDLFEDQHRSNWIRLRTLVTLRWVAIAGQMVAVCAALFLFELQFEVGLTIVAVGASVVANLFFTSLYPENRRLSEPEATMMLVFDILQLGVLLFLTGGLYNPFALLLLGPVTIAATVLHLRSTFLLGALTVVLITFLAQWSLPLIDLDGVALALPRLFLFGFWVALVTGVVFLSIYARQVTTEMNLMRDALAATQMALSREQKLTDLGGVVAAAAHEFGTPLATIKLVASELSDELEGQPELRDDVILIGEQADRCRDILRSMGRAGKEDLHLRHAPVETVVREAAEPHTDRGKSVELMVRPTGAADPRQPIILRRPEIIHGLRNLIQNAVDFAKQSVEIESTWTDSHIIVRIKDDGRGFPQSVIGRIGDPFVRRRSGFEDRVSRPGYDGMGLGLFIAKTLLERSGAKLTFANGGRDESVGAIVVVEWPRSMLESQSLAPLGENLPIEA